jgi:hypothetical protein
MAQIQERRRHQRFGVNRPCKVFHRSTRRYLCAETVDVSASGALVRVEPTRPIAVGDEISLVVAWNDEVLLAADAQVPGKVIRVLPSENGMQILACESLHPGPPLPDRRDHPHADATGDSLKLSQVAAKVAKANAP